MTRWEAASIESLYAGVQLQSTPGYQHFGSLVGPVNTDKLSSSASCSACLIVSLNSFPEDTYRAQSACPNGPFDHVVTFHRA